MILFFLFGYEAIMGKLLIFLMAAHDGFMILLC